MLCALILSISVINSWRYLNSKSPVLCKSGFTTCHFSSYIKVGDLGLESLDPNTRGPFPACSMQ